MIATTAATRYAHADGRLVALRRARGPVVVETDGRGAGRAQGPRAGRQADRRATSRPSGRTKPTLHRKVYRPWGSYDSIDIGERFQVKRITVKPGAQLSLQMHHHRAEHWIVVNGTARVTRGEKYVPVARTSRTYIPLGVKHRLENPGKLPLDMIEVQSGSYLGEDDIVRFEDRYGAKQTDDRLNMAAITGFKAYDYPRPHSGRAQSSRSRIESAWRCRRFLQAQARRGRPRHAPGSPSSAAALARGLIDSAASRCIDIGLCGTEEVYFADRSTRHGRRRHGDRQPQPDGLQRHEAGARGVRGRSAATPACSRSATRR